MNGPAPSLADRFDAGAALRLLRRHAPVLVACTALGAVAGWAYDSTRTPIYTATARLEVAPSQSRALRDFVVEEQGISTLRKSATARERLNSRDLAALVVAGLDLDQDATFLNPNSKLRPAEADRTIEDLLRRVAQRKTREATDTVQGGLSVQQVRNTGMLKVQFEHRDPVIAASVANQAVRSYLDLERERIARRAEAGLGFLQGQLGEAETALRAAEVEMLQFAEKTQLTIGENGAPAGDHGAAALRDSLAQATAARVVAERRLDQMNRNGVGTLTAAFTNDNIQNFKTLLAKLRAEYSMKRARMKPDFPAMRSLEARIANIRQGLDEELAVHASAVRAEADQAGRRERALQEELERARLGILKTQRAGIGYSALRRKVEAARKRYATIAAKLSEISVSSALVTAPATIAELATVPKAPSNNMRLLHLIGGILAFGALGVGIGAAREMLRDGFETADDLAETLQMPVLGTIPKVGTRFAPHRAATDPALREAYRFLRSNLQADALAEDGQVLLVTGASERAGVTTTARRLAFDLAAVDRRVLLVDADLVGGKLNRKLGAPDGAGLADLLEWQAGMDIASCFQPVAGTQLTLLQPGNVGPRTADQLASGRMEKILTLLRRSFDVIIVDTAPVGAQADAAVLSTLADATLLVVRSDATTRLDAQTALSRLCEARANVVGALLTRTAREQAPVLSTREFVDRFAAVRSRVGEPRRQSEPVANPVHDLIDAAAAGLSDRKAA